MKELIDKLYKERNIEDNALCQLIALADDSQQELYLFEKARQKKEEIYQDKIYIRGLIELSNYCKNNCLYCGIRAVNTSIERYRLSKEQILDCTRYGYELGFRTFVLQGGEDPAYSDEEICEIVRQIKEEHPDCAVTLSIGEKTYESYKAYKEAGADRYLLRHETATESHYQMLHPEKMSFKNRQRCLADLKSLGYQVGSGFMVGSPFQTMEHIVADLR
ncbi:MAG: [FeFe] hydrogenase H-cluster radical SAM maturase HydE, partial [Bacteroidales bacterium]|nr:[FeFe] hydrogenase H-cluster radical SAM maturase HydE [Bacteroidales bacterium]